MAGEDRQTPSPVGTGDCSDAIAGADQKQDPRVLAALAPLLGRADARAVFAAFANLMAERAAARAARVDELLRAPRSAQSVWRRIGDQIHHFDLFAALRLIECAHPHMPRLGEAMHPRDEPVRLGQEVSMAFPASSLASLEMRESGPPRLDQRILGLFGPNGALPIHLTEYAYERQHHAADPTLVHFANVFHHRMLLLFYRAWALQQPTVSADRPGYDRVGNYLAAIGGFGMPLLRDRGAVDDVVKLSHASVFGRQIHDAESLGVLLNSYFNLPIRVEEWIGHWIAVPDSQRTRLGRNMGFATLGRDAVIGARVWDAQSRFRIVVGPVGLADYRRFLPGGLSQIQLRDLVKLYVGIDLSWEMRLTLKKEEVPAPAMNNRLSLGRTCWIGGQPKPVDPQDYVWYEE